MRKKFKSLELKAKKFLASFNSGSHISLLKDSVIDVDTTRVYQPGDKKLDSKSSLRANLTMSRVFSPEKAMTILLVLDVSDSQFSKLEQSIVTCLYLTYLTDLSNDKVGLLTFSDKVHQHIQSSNDGRGVISALEKVVLEGNTDLDGMLRYLGGLELSNTLVVLISDFCYKVSDKAIQLGKRAFGNPTNMFLSLVMMNQEEWDLGKQTFAVNFKDAESENGLNWTFSAKDNKKHNSFFEKWQTDLKIRLRQAKSEPLLIPVNREDYLLPLVKYLIRS